MVGINDLNRQYGSTGDDKKTKELNDFQGLESDHEAGFEVDQDEIIQEIMTKNNGAIWKILALVMILLTLFGASQGFNSLIPLVNLANSAPRKAVNPNQSLNGGSVKQPPANVQVAPTSTASIELPSPPSSDAAAPVVLDEVPVLSTVTIKTSATFGLSRVGYSFISLDNDHLSYAHLQDFTTIIEPYADTSLWIPSATDNSFYEYSVCSTQDSSTCYNGLFSTSASMVSKNVNVPCSPYDEFTLTVVTYDIISNEETDRNEGRALCMYVRREIRSLTPTDLAKSMDAMYALWTYSDEEGTTKFGEHYHSAAYMTNLHHFNAAWQDSDHIHEGNGFLIQHLKMTNMYEASMQAVDPSVSLPYWDFTIENSMGRSAFNSYIMTPDVFGSMVIPNDMTLGFGYSNDKVVNGVIPDGRWAYLKADYNTYYPDLNMGYGYVRAPWNMNPSPYVSRFANDYRIGIFLPSCTSHYNILQTSDMMDFFYNIGFDSHATVHTMIGGIYGCELLQPLLDQGYITDDEGMKNICSKWIFYLKEFYRYNYIQPKNDCNIDEDDINSSSCGFTCTDSDSTSFKNNIKAKLSKHIPSDISDDGLQAWVDFVCEGDAYRVFAGDHLESASPADPSFWVIHPTLDRLFQAKMMSGGFDTSEWASDVRSGFVCEKSRCYEPDEGYLGYHDDCCLGHFENDQLLDAVTGDRTLSFGPTNAEVVRAGDPTSIDYSNTYIYDSFTWTHCSQDFDGMLREMYSTRRK